ncbi:rod shape-determining protein [Streptomyces olivoreticuli]
MHSGGRGHRFLALPPERPPLMSDDLEQLRRCSLAFDLGTARTRIHLKDVGMIVDEPSAVALCARTGRLIAAGSAAQALEGRAPGTTGAVRVG